MTFPRVYTPAEVDSLIPRLSELVKAQLERQSEIEECLAELARYAGGLPRTLELEASDAPEIARLKTELTRRIGVYEDGWTEVQALGAVVKDPQIGLLDFYGKVEGRLVWLCWRYGEESLRYWHDLDAGYAGRRALKPDVRGRLWN
jgi:hypothetical protein